MRTIAVMNQKGGVGKTTTAVNLAAALAESGCRVCLIDIDPQAHATLHLGRTPQRGETTIYDVLTGEVPLSAARGQVAENLWLVSSQIDLAAAEVELAGVVGRELILRDRLTAETETFDYVLIDCPPSLGLLTINALATVEEVILPLQPHFLALHGLSKLLSTLDLVHRRLNNRLRLSGVVLCMYDAATKLAAEVSHDVQQFFSQPGERPACWSATAVFQTRIRRNVRLAEAPSYGQSIFRYAPNCNGADDYRALAREITAVGSHTAQRRAA